MELIKESKSKYRWGKSYTYAFFKCDFCGCEIERLKSWGLKAKYCTHKCYIEHRINKGHYRHGAFLRNKILFSIWAAIIQRTSDEKSVSFKNYGARGIYVCYEWFDPNIFIDWALANGYKKGLEIDRINNDDDYSPSNCQFTTKSINNINKRKREDFGIYNNRNHYEISLTRNNIHHYGGSSIDLNKARKLRDNLLIKIENYGN